MTEKIGWETVAALRAVAYWDAVADSTGDAMSRGTADDWALMAMRGLKETR